MDNFTYMCFVVIILAMGISTGLLFKFVAIFITDARSNSYKTEIERINQKQFINQFIYFYITCTGGFIAFISFLNVTNNQSHSHGLYAFISAMTIFLYSSAMLYLCEGLRLRCLFKQKVIDRQIGKSVTTNVMYKNLLTTKRYYVYTVPATFFSVALYFLSYTINFSYSVIIFINGYLICLSFKALKYVNKKYLTEKIVFYLIIGTITSILLMIFATLYFGVKTYPVFVIATQGINFVLWSGALMFLIMSDNAHIHYQNSIIDSLTGIYNRRYFSTELNKHCNENMQSTHTTALLICDIDDFKVINDQYGHDIGDCALQHFVRTLEPNIRDTDIFARVGGEEFAIILPDTDIETAKKIAQSICLRIQSIPMNLQIFNKKSNDNQLVKADRHKKNSDNTMNNDNIIITASIGVAISSASQYCDPTKLYKYADQAMYQSKKSGKNQVTVHDSCIMNSATKR